MPEASVAEEDKEAERGRIPQDNFGKMTGLCKIIN